MPLPRQLPACGAHFVGRTAELALLRGLLDPADGAPALTPAPRATMGTTLLVAIAGTAGVGKTALALHFAHLVADRYPDGQLYVNLRGFGPLGEPLPLALSIAAARAADRPGFPLAMLAAELRDPRRRLDALDGGEAAANVRDVFSWSYQQLSPPAARMFCLLGLHPGPDITVLAAAGLAGVRLDQAGRALGELTAACLLREHAPGRYAFHDLLRAYAAEQAEKSGHLPETDADS